MDEKQLFDNALEAIRSGDAAEGRRLLLELLKVNPRNETAWMWLVRVLPNDLQRLTALEQCLKYNPSSETARRALGQLRQRMQESDRPQPTSDTPPAARPVSAPPTSPLSERLAGTADPAPLAPAPPQPNPQPAPTRLSERLAGRMPPAFPNAAEPSKNLAAPNSRPAINQAPLIGGVEVESLRPKNRWFLPRIQFRIEWLLILILSAAAVILAVALRNASLVPLRTDPLRSEALLATAEMLETQNAALRQIAADKATQAAARPTATATPLPTQTATPQPTPTHTATPTIALPNTSALLPISPDTVLSLAPAAGLPGEFTLAAVFSPDSRLLASASASGLQIWSLPSLELVRTVESEQVIQALAFSPDSTRLVYSRSGEGNLGYLWGFDVQDGVNFTEGVLFARQLIGLAYTADGSRVVMAGLAFDQNVLLADPDSGFADVLFDHPGGVRSIVTAPASSLLASGGSDGVVRIWDASLPGAVYELPGPGPAVVSLAWSPRQDLLAGGLEDGKVILWDARTWQQVGSLEGVAGSVTGLAFSPDGQLLAGLGSDGSLTIWAGINDAPIYRSDAPPGGRALAFSSNSFFLASAHESGLTLWAVAQPSGGD